MRAWRFTGTGSPLQVADVEPPRPGPGQVVVDVRAAGLCHTDVGILDDPGWLQRLGPLPLTLGHEVAGVVSELGDGVAGVSVGDAVGISPAGSTRPGLARDGGYAASCVADVADLVPIPPGVSFRRRPPARTPAAPRTGR
jgi:propanol-preferring alcohol dehydrogenase